MTISLEIVTSPCKFENLLCQILEFENLLYQILEFARRLSCKFENLLCKETISKEIVTLERNVRNNVRECSERNVRNTSLERMRECSACDRAERWRAGVETQKNVRGEVGGWGRVPFNEPYAPSLSTIYDGA